MRTIWKWVIPMRDECEITVRGQPEFLYAAMQEQQLCVWACVDDSAPARQWTVRVVGTGGDAKRVGADRHIGTALDNYNGFVWHIFDGGPADARAH